MKALYLILAIAPYSFVSSTTTQPQPQLHRPNVRVTNSRNLAGSSGGPRARNRSIEHPIPQPHPFTDLNDNDSTTTEPSSSSNCSDVVVDLKDPLFDPIHDTWQFVEYFQSTLLTRAGPEPASNVSNYIAENGISDLLSYLRSDYERESWREFKKRHDEEGVCKKECSGFGSKFMPCLRTRTQNRVTEKGIDALLTHVSEPARRVNGSSKAKYVISYFNSTVSGARGCFCQEDIFGSYKGCHTCIRKEIKDNSFPEISDIQNACKKAKSTKEFAAMYWSAPSRKSAAIDLLSAVNFYYLLGVPLFSILLML